MNLTSLLTDLQTLAAYTHTGTVQTARLRTVINVALRHLWADMPEALLREEYRFKLEVPVSVSTISIDSTDRRVFTLDVAATSPPQLNTTGILRARWLEVKRSGKYIYRRIRDVYVEEIVDAPDLLHIVIDRPWDNNTDTGLTYRIITREYPYPSDVKDIVAVYYDPENGPSEVIMPLTQGELNRKRWAEGWREQGRITRYARGRFYQEPAPHEKPTVSTQTVSTDADKWGYDSDGIAHTINIDPAYGNAGTFQYCYCLVWGRWPWSHLSVGDRGDGVSDTAQGPLDPFYISAPSQPTDAVTTTWGAGYINIASLDVDYQWGYGPTNSLKSYHHWGAEKWWFRRRTASEAVGSAAPYQEDPDSVWYLWRITPGYTTSVQDRGQYDPVDKRVRLEHLHGHQHLVFDKLPSEEKEMLAIVVRRPPELAHDHDYVRVPPECEMALINLAHAYLLGRREGEPNKESHYWNAYITESARLAREYGLASFVHGPFGDGLGASVIIDHVLNDISETT